MLGPALRWLQAKRLFLSSPLPRTRPPRNTSPKSKHLNTPALAGAKLRCKISGAGLLLLSRGAPLSSCRVLQTGDMIFVLVPIPQAKLGRGGEADWRVSGVQPDRR